MSILGKKWVVQNGDGAMTVMAKLLQNRGIDSPAKAEAFFGGSLSDVHDPLLLTDMAKAAERLSKAIRDHEKIMVFGDYDVDGITGTALLYGFLKTVGADAYYTLPHREDDGYGLKGYFIERFKQEAVNLVVTVDCGTSNLAEIELANRLGIDVVVTDHHSMPKILPPAHAVVNPKRPDCAYPNKEICGSSLAYKLVCHLAPAFLGKDAAEAYLRKQLGIVALGVIGDCMALKGENRIFVREGLKSLVAGEQPGITALLEEAGIDLTKVDSGTLAFQVSPRINAAGRLDIPHHAFELILGKLEKAVLLNELNEKRKILSRQFVEEAKAQISTLNPLPNIVVARSQQWKAGLLGLVASALTEEFGRPAIAMFERENDFVASMRSVNQFDLTSHLRERAIHLFSAFGGHVMAGGFTLPKENFGEFMKHVQAIAETQVEDRHFGGTLSIDCEIRPDEITFETLGKLRRLEPFGHDNPAPTLLVRHAKILDIRGVGKNAEHLQMPVQYGGRMFKTIAFRFGPYLAKIDPLKPQDLVVSLELNEWNGNRNLQLRIIDLRPSSPL